VLGPVLLNPQSRGSVELGSSRSSDDPRIRLNMFAQEEDFERIYSGACRLHAVIEGSHLGPLNAADYTMPKCGFDVADKATLKAQLREHSQTL